MAGSPSASLFNGGIFLPGIATIAASIGIYTAARRESPSKLWPVLAGLSLGLLGVGGLVTKANEGLYQRLYALMIFGWVGIASYALLRPVR